MINDKVLTNYRDASKYTSLLVFVLAWSCCIKVHGQSAAGNTSWKLLREDRGLKFFYSVGDCGSQSKIWLKGTNTRDTTVMVNFDLVAIDKGVTTVIPGERMEIAARGETVIDCEPHGPHALPIQYIIQQASDFECRLASYSSQNLIR